MITFVNVYLFKIISFLIFNFTGIRQSEDEKLLEIEWEMLSFWFGADLSLVSKESNFVWPRQAIESCNGWLKAQYEK